MKTKNSIFIATSLDGYIADRNGRLDWLNTVPNPHNDDMGYVAFTSRIDAIVMGRNTYETVVGFGVDWPYDKPVFVLSKQLKEIPKHLNEKVFLINGSLPKILEQIHQRGYNRLYIDGGVTIQHFLEEDLIDEMVLTHIPILLGGGVRLFSEMPKLLKFELIETKTYLKQVVQTLYRIVR